MFLGEPARTDYDLNFEIFRVHVRVHPFFWLMTVMFGFAGAGMGGTKAIIGIFIWVLAVFVSILVHELGHVFMMARFGERARVVLYGMGGLAIPDGYDSFFSRPARRDMVPQVLISAAGPAAGFLLAGAIIALLVAFAMLKTDPDARFYLQLSETGNYALSSLISAMLFINIFWGIINLVPVFPLDGGQIARAIFVYFDAWDGMRKSLWLSVICGAGVAILGLSLGSFFMAIMFGILAYQSWQLLQQISGGRPW